MLSTKFVKTKVSNKKKKIFLYIHKENLKALNSESKQVKN